MASFNLKGEIPNGWKTELSDACASEAFVSLETYLAEEYETQTVFPPVEQIFNALRLTPFDDVRVVILGQDPYHGAGQAHGLAFSVCDGVKIPPSLRNMFKELETDLGIEPAKTGNLTAWGTQGILLLNTSLTVREKSAGSHAKKGWVHFTDAVIAALNEREQPMVFVLWGGHAKKKKAMIDESRHVVLESAHPSPLSARTGFFGSKPFSQTNSALEGLGLEPIEWDLNSV